MQYPCYPIRPRRYGTIKKLYITRYGGPEVLEVREEPDPVPKAGQVRIRVARAGLNFADISARVGLYPDAPKPPMVVGYEVSGTVDAVGEGVTRVKPGMRVLSATAFGGQADCVVPAEALVQPIPDGMGFDEAAALPVNYLTAYHMLFQVAQVRPGDKVLLHAAAGGVGLAAIQLMSSVGGVEIFGTASARKHEFLRKAGVQHPIDYRTQDYAEEVRRLTGGKGVRLVLDALGGPDWTKGFELLQPGGQLIAYGWSNMIAGTSRNLLRVVGQLFKMRRYSPIQLMSKNRTVSGVNMGTFINAPELLRPELEAVMRLYAEGHVRPHVDKVFPLSQGAEAHRYLQEGKNTGKVLFDCAA